VDRFKTIQAFIATAKAGSFAAAARNLRQSRALISRQIADLEAHLGVRLFARTTRDLSITSAGRQYLEVCERVFQNLHEVEADLGKQQRELRGVLRVVSVRSFGERHLARAVADFSQLHPYLRVEMELAPGTRTAIQLSRSAFDVGIAIAPMTAAATVARRIAEFDWVLCAGEDYLRRCGSPAHVSDLTRHVTLTNQRHTPGGIWTFRRGGAVDRVHVEPQISITNFWSLREAVLAGSGIAILPSFCIIEDIRAGRIIPLLEDCLIERSVIRSQYPHYRGVPQRARTFADFLRARFDGSFVLRRD
jgi:DNA-binding transcriptional LysR family regulator